PPRGAPPASCADAPAPPSRWRAGLSRSSRRGRNPREGAAMVTRVYVQNHTTDSFLADRRSVRFPPRDPLPQRAFEWLTRSIDPSKRKPLLEFDRGSNVADGEDYEFRTDLRAGGASIELRQRMRGTPLHSKLWQSAGDHPWFDDEQFHTVIWPTPRGLVEIVYRSYNTAGDNDI